MTPELQHRWQISAAPFDGKVAATCDEPEMSIVLDMLMFTSERLRQQYPAISVFPDWHEHDGIIVDSRSITWESFLSRLASKKTLYESRESDDYVRVAVLPDTFEWLLRYNIEDADGDYDNAWCEFDLSSTPDAFAADLVQELCAKWPGYMDLSDAKTHFDNSYGG